MKLIHLLCLAAAIVAIPLVVGASHPREQERISNQFPSTPVWICGQCGYSTTSHTYPGLCPRDGRPLRRGN